MVPLETLQWSTSYHIIPKLPPMGFSDPPVTRERMRSGRTLTNWTVTIQVIILDRQLTVPLEVDCLGEAVTPLTGDGTECDVP